MTNKLLVLDTACSYEVIRDWKLDDFVTCRDLGGFFEHVWTVHPFASIDSAGKAPKFGAPQFHELTPMHTFIDGKIGRFAVLDRIPALNFALSQAEILAKLIRLVQRERISAVRTCEPLYTGLLGLCLSRLCGIPLIIRVNANYDKIFESTNKAMNPRLFRSYRVEKRVLRFVLSRADLVAAVNEDNLDFAIANGARREFSTIFRYGNLIDRRHISLPETRDLSGEVLKEFWDKPHRFLMHVGRLQSLKFPEDPIKVLAAVRKRGHDVKLLMVGDGPERAALTGLSRNLEIEGHVVFTGNRDQDWLSRVFPLAAVVLSPLTGRALSEAAFGGAPIVAYDLDWQGELIRTGESGELVPFRALEKMIEAVERLIVDTEEARRMGRGARKRAFELMDPERLNDHERTAYTELFRRFNPA